MSTGRIPHAPADRRVARWRAAAVTLALLLLAAAVAAGSLLLGSRDPEHEFAGTDGQAEAAIARVAPGYEPWFTPFVGELPGEVESGLFALQAGLGGVVLGGAIGWYAGRHRGRAEGTAVDDRGA